MNALFNKLILLCATLAFVASTVTVAGARDLDTINVSYVKSPFNLQIMVMKSTGMLEKTFAKDNIKINWVEINSGAKQSQALAAGSLDIASVINTTSVLLANAGGNPVKIIGGVSHPCETFAIVVRSDGPQTVAELKGKTVAGPKGTVLHQMLAVALAKEGLKESDVKFVHMGLPKARTALLAGQVDAALLAASLVIKSEEAGARVLTTAKGLVQPILVSAASQDFIVKHPDLVARYLKTFRQAMKFIDADPEKAIAIGAKEHGISIQDAHTLYNWAGFTTHLSAADIVSMREDMVFLQDNNMIKTAVDPASVCMPAAFME
ncbi:aliphatic sulfonate ABC transporter substrate-binding protein [uncultured Pseudodesulfovibrio sp.]|uniref:ABC transporter substrate-binding protein n=1 Tax=uncultured Pseudodesulfovibrio sp. TaxID=2035858 RepID=UPI0029C8D285|nr:aliphatic sulfonate ABC transporter substrate-binding protein [uncultured Pseudodesulfovibrio sp.]